ncbi:MAG: D-2-hydroxyacid dehydrogenase [Gammaproteobacteria bacterium]|nr:D-2-hydroxyacid dehydrogenase [Gammaproteobacteria bacterium]
MNIVIMTGLTLPEVDETALAKINEAGGGDTQITVVSSANEALQYAADTDVLFGFCPRQLLRAAPKLRWVHAISSGVDMFLYPEFVEGDVILTSEKGLVGEHLADTGFGLLLALTRKIKAALAYGPDSWNHRPEMRFDEIELTGRVMGIIGFGGTGRAMARRAKAFGMQCQAVDRDPVEPTAEVSKVWGTDRLDELLETSDVVAVCCPLTTETRGLLNEDAFARMKAGAFLVNVTRGEVIVEDALVGALASGHLRGAALDVAPREPLPEESPLWSLDNVAMTPHTAGASQFRAERNIERFCRNLVHLRAEEPLEGVIDKHLGY